VGQPIVDAGGLVGEAGLGEEGVEIGRAHQNSSLSLSPSPPGSLPRIPDFSMIGRASSACSWRNSTTFIAVSLSIPTFSDILATNSSMVAPSSARMVRRPRDRRDTRAQHLGV